jgi:serine/threonine protein phosphatase PrpC
VCVGHQGDSRAVLLKKQGSESEGFSLVPHPLSRDHKPQLPSETKRILLKGGHIASITYDDGVDGPPRVWLRDEGVPGLAMSRSVGDTIGKKAGVCSEVEFKEVALREEDVCVVVASDGLWEFLTNQLVADAVAAVAAETGGDEVRVLRFCVSSPHRKRSNYVWLGVFQTEWMKRSLQQLTLMATQSWSNAEGVTDDTSIILGLIGQTPV